MYGTQLAIHFFRKNKVAGGKIITTASVAGIIPHETFPEYDGAKAAVVNFVRATARILKAVGFHEQTRVMEFELTNGRKKTSRSMQYALVSITQTCSRPSKGIESGRHCANGHFTAGID